MSGLQQGFWWNSWGCYFLIWSKPEAVHSGRISSLIITNGICFKSAFRLSSPEPEQFRQAFSHFYLKFRADPSAVKL